MLTTYYEKQGYDRRAPSVHYAYDRCRIWIFGQQCRYSREVEEVLLYHRKLSEVSVMGKPGVEWGEIVVDFISGKDVDAAEPDCFCVDNIA